MKKLTLNAPQTGLLGFTLIEVLVSTALIGLIMALLLSTVDQTSKLWSRTTSKLSQFQAARAGFEAISRNLSQATLNTNWQVDPPRPSSASQMASWTPKEYVRASDLHFVCGKASDADLLGDEDKFPTHCIFFQAPLGATELQLPKDVRKFGALENLLTAVGYYIEWSDNDLRPAFLDLIQPAPAKRWRYRLMQVKQPTEELNIYAMNKNSQFKSTDWIKAAIGQKVSGVAAGTSSPHFLAENIVALILIPKLSDRSATASATGVEKLTLSPKYRYDSRPADSNGQIIPWNGSGASVSKMDPERQWFNQLPPIVEVIAVAIDEKSALSWTSKDPPKWSKGLFPKQAKPTVTSMTDVYDDLDTLQANLLKDHMNFRTFSQEVVIRGSKWTKPEIK